MTPRLDRFLYKWSLYKKSLIVFLAVNVFSVTLALVLGFNYFVIKRNLGIKQQASITKIESADTALDQLQEFESESSARTRFEIRTREDEKKILDILARWQVVKSSVEAVTGQALGRNMSFLIPTAESRLELQNIKLELMNVKKAELKSLQAGLTQHNDTTKLIIITGLITLIFGILLPHFILYLMGRTLNHIRKEIQNSALEFIKAWTETKAGFGDEAFKNVDFWLQVLLLLGQQAGSMSSHPAAQVSSELAHIVRLELQKKPTDTTSPTNAA